jgi:hypothetical protein
MAALFGFTAAAGRAEHVRVFFARIWLYNLAVVLPGSLSRHSLRGCVGLQQVAPVVYQASLSLWKGA